MTEAHGSRRRKHVIILGICKISQTSRTPLVASHDGTPKGKGMEHKVFNGRLCQVGNCPKVRDREGDVGRCRVEGESLIACQTVAAFSSFASNCDAACRRRADEHVDLVRQIVTVSSRRRPSCAVS